MPKRLPPSDYNDLLPADTLICKEEYDSIKTQMEHLSAVSYIISV